MSLPSGASSLGPTEAMVGAIVRLREALGEVRLPFMSPERAVDQNRVRALTDQIEDYILPRLMQADAPLLAVVGGSTGAGKSTLVNSLVGRRVTEPGLLRPTTRSPVLVHHPDDAAWFANPLLLPDLRRSHSTTAEPGTLQLVPSDALAPGLAILDAPDIDSVDEHNRELAAQLLAAADMWLFVTSAARYADQIPWQYLGDAAERSVSVAVILDRTQPGAVEEVRAHLARMLASRGHRDAPLFAIPESELLEDGRLPETAVAELRTWLRDFASNAVLRQEIVDDTLRGAIRQLAKQSHAVADEAIDQVDRAAALSGALATAYEDAIATSRNRLWRGEIVRGEVLARWAGLVSGGDLVRGLESRMTRLRSLVRGGTSESGHDQAFAALEAVDEGIRLMLVDEAELTVLRVADVTAEAHVVDASEMNLLAQVSADFVSTVARAVEDWQRSLSARVHDLVDAGGTPARLKESDVPGLCLLVTILVGTSALDEAASRIEQEITSARDSAADIGAAVLGQDALNTLVSSARDELAALVASSFGVEQRRAEAAVARLGARVESAEQLRRCARKIDDLRFAAQLPTEIRPEPQSGGEW